MNHLTVKLYDILQSLDVDFDIWMGDVNSTTNSAIKTLCDGVNDVIDNVNTINTTLANKVDKVTGKGLSTNDYTTVEKNKLQGIKDGATKTETSTTNGNIKIDGVEKTIYTHPTTHAASMITEDATHKFVTDIEKTKIEKSLTLDSIEAGANVTINKDTTTNKMVINATGGGGSGSATWDTTTGKPFNTVDVATMDTTNSTLKVKDNVFASKTHNHDGIYQPTGDYATNANVDTKITTHNTNATAHTDIRNAIPTKNSQLTNDSDYATTSQIPNVSNKLEATNIKAGTGVTVGINGNDVTINATGGSGGTSDYNDLTNKPSVNGVTLTGDKTSDDLKLTEVVISSTQPTTPYKIWFESVASGSGTLDNSYALKSYVDTEDAKRIKYTDIVNDLTTGGANVPLSAEMGKQLFQSGVDFKTDVAGAITTKGVTTSATDTKQTFVNNILAIPQTNNGGSITYLENITEDFALGMLDGVKAENNSLVLNGVASGNRLSPKIFIPITNNKSSLINWNGNGSIGTICVDKGVDVGGGIDNQTVMLLHCEDFTDSSLNKCVVSTQGISVVGGGKFSNCFYFNGTSSECFVDSKNTLDFKTANFTIDFWVMITSNKTTHQLFSISGKYFTSLPSVGFQVHNNKFRLIMAEEIGDIMGNLIADISSSNTIELNKFYHIELCRNNNNIFTFINGTKINEMCIDIGNKSLKNYTSPLYIGNEMGSDSVFLNGKIDEFRISNTVRHTSNFTPPTRPYSKIDTSLVIPQTKNTQLQGLPTNLTNKDIYLYETLTTGQSISNVSMNIKGDVEYTIHPNGAVTQSTYQQALSQNMILQNTLNKVVK